MSRNKKARVRALGNSLLGDLSDNVWYASDSEVQAWFKTIYDNPASHGFTEVEVLFYRGELRRWNASTSEWEISGRLANGTVYWMYVRTPFDESLDVDSEGVDFFEVSIN